MILSVSKLSLEQKTFRDRKPCRYQFKSLTWLGLERRRAGQNVAINIHKTAIIVSFNPNSRPEINEKCQINVRKCQNRGAKHPYYKTAIIDSFNLGLLHSKYIADLKLLIFFTIDLQTEKLSPG